MTTSSTNQPWVTNTDAGVQNYINEILTGLNAIGLTQVNDTGSITTSNYNASVVVNAQTATSVLTVNSVTSGGNNICVGMQVVGAGIAAGTYITSFGTGTGGTGTYNLSTTPGTIAAESMTISFKVPGATATFYGYSIFRFNDTLQATSPVYFKLEWGSGNVTTTPQMLITCGTGTNGAGTITGTTISRSAAGYGSSANLNNGGANYQSYFCYNATQGIAWMGFKFGSVTAGVQTSFLGFCLYRSVDNTGAPTADTIHCLCNNANTTSGTSSGGNLPFYDYNRGVQNGFNTTSPNGTTGAWAPTVWGVIPFNNYSSVMGTTAQVFPCFQWKGNSTTPGLGITNALALGGGPDWVSIGTTGTITIIGSTSLTYIAVPCITGYPLISLYTPAFTGGAACMLLVWQ